MWARAARRRTPSVPGTEFIFTTATTTSCTSIILRRRGAQLLANLGMAAGPDYLFTPDGERHFVGADSSVVVRSLDRVVISSMGSHEPESFGARVKRAFIG